MTTECQGTWHLQQEADDGPESKIEVLRCSGCREWWIILNYGAFGPYPPTLTMREAVAAAITDHLQQKRVPA